MKSSILDKLNFLVVFTLFCLLGMAGTCWATSANDGFDPGANNDVRSIAIQADGKIVVGGFFTTIGGQTRNRIARLYADGSVDAGFNPGANSNIYSIALQADDKIVVGGSFTTIGGQTRNYIARLNSDGSVDDGFNPGANSAIYSIAIQADGKIVVGGYFTSIGGYGRNYIARLHADGSVDTGFNPGANNDVRSIVLQADGKIVVGGNFTTIGGQTRSYIARLNSDGSVDDGFNPGVNNPVYSIAHQADGKIVVGGGFTTIGGQARDRIARLHADGSLDTGFNPGANNIVYSIALQADGKIVVGGYFTTIGGQARNYIARLHGSGSVDASFNPGASSYIYSIALQADGKIVVGGFFTTIGGQTRNRIARLHGSGSVDASFNPEANNNVRSIAIQADGKIVVGGSFTTIGGQARNYIARLNADGSVDESFNPGANDTVYSIAIQADGKIVVGGFFTTIGGQARDRIARLHADGSLDTGFNPGANNIVYSIALQADGKIVVGGWFTTIGGQARNHIARLHADGSVDTSFNPGANFAVHSIALQADGKILVGGLFTSIGGQARSYIARLNSDGIVDASFGAGTNNFVHSIAIQADGKIVVGGWFTMTPYDYNWNYIARFDAYGSVDINFNTGANNIVYSIALQADGKIVVGGNFTTISGQARDRIARLNVDGSVDAGFNPGANDKVYSIALQADGKILVGGLFTTIGGQARNCIARLSADEAALQNLAVSADGTAITWSRGQSSPEIHDVTFEHSNDLANWTFLGAGTRISGGWQLGGLSLTRGVNGYVRGRGQALGGYDNASTSLMESVRLYYLPATINVTSPNGGESWTAGESHDITWTSIGTVGNVNIDYSTNNGGDWTPVAANTANDGTQTWTIPSTPSTTCLVRVRDAVDNNPSDSSDAVFTILAYIAPTITVTSPNGGENWTVGDSHDITWSSTGAIANVNIDCSTNNGSNWTSVVVGTASDGSYSWTIPAAPSTTCLVRVSDTDGDPSDTSDAVFTIADAETVSTPTTPTGPSTGLITTSYDFSTGDSTSSLGHDVEYFFDWDDGSDSGWLAVGTTEASHSWAAAGTYDVRAMARCATHSTVESLWSDDLTVTISDGSSSGYYNSPASRQILPEVIWAPATGGGTWVSDVQLVDVSGGSQVTVYYSTAAGRRGPFLLWNNSGGSAMSSVKYANLLQTIDGLDSGSFTYDGTVGAVEFATQDGSHLIHVAVRELNGNYAKTFPGLNLVDEATAGLGRNMIIPNLANNATYRTTCGFYNPTADAVTMELKLLGASGVQTGGTVTRTLAGYEFTAFNPFTEAGVPYPGSSYDNVTLKVEPTTGSGSVMCFGATANNTSNDPAAHLAVQASGYDNGPSNYKILPEVIWASATGGGTWVSDVQVVDVSGGSQVTVYYSTAAGRRGPFLLWNNSGGSALSSVKYANLLQTIDGLDSGAFTYNGTVGAVEFATQDSGHLIHVAVRELNGNYAKTFPGLNLVNAETAGTGRLMIIPNLANNATYRTTCGFYNPTADAVTMELKLLGASGVQTGGTITRTLAGYEFTAFNPFTEAGLPYPGSSYDNVKLKVEPTTGSGSVMCFGATANNTSNDPAAHIAVQGQ